MAKTNASELLEGQEEIVEESEPEQVVEEPVVDEAPVEQEVVDEPDEPVEEEAAPPSFLEQLGEFGFENVADERDAQGRLLDAYRQTQSQLEEIQREREQLKTFAEYGRQYLDELRQKQTPVQEQSQETPKHWWQPPEFNRSSLEKYRELDPTTQQWRWKEGTPAEVRSGAEAYQAYLETWADKLTTNPVEALQPFEQSVLEKARELVREELRNDREKNENETFIEQLRRENDWLFQRDPRTNQSTSMLSPEGQRVMELVDEAVDLGITDPKKQWQYANRVYAGEKRAGETAVQSTADARRKQHLRKSVPSRAGSRPSREQADERPRNVNHTAGQNLLEQLEQDGVGIL